jgi:HlyD family secretion protein
MFQMMCFNGHAMKILQREVGRSNGQASVPPPTPPRRYGRLIAGVVLAIFAALTLGLVIRSRLQPQVGYISAQVVRKDLVQTVTATGTVNPQNTILVGTQDSGTITEQDADYNSVVKKGQVLTKLDPTSFHAALDNAQAAESQAQSAWSAGLASSAAAEQNVIAAQEALSSAKAQVAKAKAGLYLANVTLRRDVALLKQGYIAQQQADNDTSLAAAAKSAYDAAVIAVPQAQAQLQASVAQWRSAQESAAAGRAAVDVQRAAVATARYNLDNTIIRSQVNGTVIARNVTIGQTVAASFQTPTLFTLGQNLAKMEVDVAVGEPDIGGVRAGDVADFTVLAYPNRSFHGIVYQVRQNPTTINNVVTYDTVVYVNNGDGALYPGMTANASIHVAKVRNVLVVPIAALQYAPPESQRKAASASAQAALSPWGVTEASMTRTVVAGRNGRVFVLHAGRLARVPVRVLLVSDTEAAVAPLRTVLSAGDTVVTADTASLMAAQQAAAGSALMARPTTLGRPGGGASH